MTTTDKPKRRYKMRVRKAEPCIVCEDAPTMDRVCNHCVLAGLAHKCQCGEWTVNRGRVCTGCLRRAGL
jgi:hypothetical protein